MHSEDEPLRARSDGEGAESFGNFRLTGMDGRLRTVLTEEALRLERSDGRGIRIQIKSIISLRLIPIAPVPNGFAVLSALLLLYGLRIAPPSLMPYTTAGSVLTLGLWMLLRTDTIVIETAIGDRHRLQGNSESLKRLKRYLDLMMDGSTLELAQEELRIDRPTATPFTIDLDTQQSNEKNLADALAAHVNIGGFLNTDSDFQTPLSDQPSISTPSFMSDWRDSLPSSEETSYGMFGEAQRNRAADALRTSQSEVKTASSAFEAPPASIDTDTGGIFGSLFDEPATTSTPVPEYSRPSIEDDLASARRSYDEFSMNAPSQNTGLLPAPVPTPVERPLSSSQMIRRAQNEFGPFDSAALPAPSTDAVRDECRTDGLVASARRIEIQDIDVVDAEIIEDKTTDPLLEERPMILRMLQGGEKKGRIVIRPRKPSPSRTILGLVPPFRQRAVRRRAMSILRLRSDQEHQAQRVEHLQDSIRSEGSDHSVNDGVTRAMDSINATLDQNQIAPPESITLAEMKPTRPDGKESQYPGLRRFG